LAEPDFAELIYDPGGPVFVGQTLEQINLEGREMVDRYTKVVLTVIAVCLAIIAARDLPFARNAIAQDNKVHVVVDEVNQWAFRWGLREPVPVKIQN
jgi:hypothetical protein